MMSDLKDLQAKYRRTVNLFGKRSDQARKARAKLEEAVNADLLIKERVRVPAKTERRV